MVTPSPTPPAIPFTAFNAPLDTIYDEAASETLDRDYWRVGKAFRFYLGDPSEERWVNIPVDYLTDGASVPRLFWDLLPPWGQYGQAAVVHDWLCENLTVDVKGVATPIVRREADKAFKEGMEALNVPSWKRNLMYMAVRGYTAYLSLRAKLGFGDYSTVKAQTNKKVYLLAHPTMVPVDNEDVAFDT